LKTVVLSAILDSDDDDGEELPDAPSPVDDIQRTAPKVASAQDERPVETTSPVIISDETSKIVEIQSLTPTPGVAKQENESGFSASSFKEAVFSPKALPSDDTTSSPAQPAKPLNIKKDTTLPKTSNNRSTQGKDYQPDTESLPSPGKLGASSPLLGKKAATPNKATREISQRSEEASQVTNIPSSPPQRDSEVFFEAKKNQTPSVSFPVTEALQNRDVLMAELKTMKIVSPVPPFSTMTSC
jgi:hypothetical protein